MGMRLGLIEAEVMNLSQSERTHLLERLTASLCGDAEIQAAWANEAAKRDAQIEAGEVVCIPCEQVFAKHRSLMRYF